MTNIDTQINKVNRKITLVMKKSRRLLPCLYTDATLVTGKRLRARAYFLFSGEASEKSIAIVSAIELLHAATLIHDDVVDGSKIRRGRPALYVSQGIPSTLLYGDYLLSTAFNMIAELDDNRVYKQMTAGLGEVLIGEMIEYNRKRDISLNKKEYLSIISKKSGVLFGLACALGAAAGKSGKRTTEESYRFGLYAGMAYQIMDDYLDYFGADVYKENLIDLREGVMTLPLIYLLKRCGKTERRNITRILKENKLKACDIKDILLLMIHYDVPGAVSKDLEFFLEKAKKHLPGHISAKMEGKLDILSWISGKVQNDKA